MILTINKAAIYRQIKGRYKEIMLIIAAEMSS